ncbi:MAG: ABC transporter substrate-binding protein [Candidatus Saccharibacteria bacterium]|nr:ABC transporter substrate-binding protein [Moraxellaceae bacterium]
MTSISQRIVLLTALHSLAVSSSFAKPMTTHILSLNDHMALSAHPSSLPYSNPNAPKGGEFSTFEIGTFDNLNALINTGSPVNGTAYLSDSLLSASLNEPSASYGLLADSITRDPEDPSWIAFHINPKAYFSNLQPVTAEDVVFTFNTILSKGSPGLRLYYAGIKKITALDKYTVRFDFKVNNSTMSRKKNNIKLALSIGQMSIFSRQDWQNRIFDQVTLRPPLGSGPYLIDKIDAGRSITYKRNPNYWGRDLMINRGKYNFDQIKYVYYRDPEAAYQGFKLGQYTFKKEQSAQNWVKNYNFPAVDKGFVVKQTIANKNPITMSGLVFNLRQDQFKDRRVRKALTQAFDFEWLNKALFNNTYTRLQSYFFNSELEAKGTPSVDEVKYLTPLLPLLSQPEKDEILNPWTAPVSAGDGFNRANLLTARQLLLDAGYRYKKGQLYDQHDKIYSIDILCSDASLQRTLLPYVRNLKRLGISASIRLVDTPQYIERVRRFDYDMIVDTYPQTLSPSHEQIGYWGSASADRQGSLNTAGIKNPVIDMILTELGSAQNRQAVIHITRILDRVLRAEYYMVPLYGLVGNRVVYWNKYRLQKITANYDLGLDYWWIDQAAEQHIKQYIGRQ